MKENIHPQYYKIKVTCTSCGTEYEVGSTSNKIRVDTCANCHPFYTGKQRFVSSQGRAEIFKKKYGMK